MKKTFGGKIKIIKKIFYRTACNYILAWELEKWCSFSWLHEKDFSCFLKKTIGRKHAIKYKDRCSQKWHQVLCFRAHGVITNQPIYVQETKKNPSQNLAKLCLSSEKVFIWEGSSQNGTQSACSPWAHVDERFFHLSFQKPGYQRVLPLDLLSGRVILSPFLKLTLHHGWETI